MFEIMTAPLRSYLAIVLCLLLVMATQAMAVTRGAANAFGVVELCSGDDVVTIYVDDTGEPIAASHICPECLPLSLAGLLPGEVTVAAPLRLRHGSPVQANAIHTLHLRLTQQARAPPVSV